MVTIEDAQKANDLVNVLVEGIETQQEILNGLRDALNDYTEFLAKELKELQNEDL